MNANKKVAATDLIFNPDGSVYHLHLHKVDISQNVILVGDPERVNLIAELLDEVNFIRQNREFRSAQGSYNQKEFTIISTGIGIGNVDIVLNEIDALINFDEEGFISENLRSLNIVRIGTSGAIREEIAPGTVLLNSCAIGLDNLLQYYMPAFSESERELHQKLKHISPIDSGYYVAEGSSEIAKIFRPDYLEGISVVAPGFYGPQNRQLRLSPRFMVSDLFHSLSGISHKGLNITNLEMEASAVMGLSKLLGHKAISLDLILANRITHEFKASYADDMKALCYNVLKRLSENQI